MEETIKKLDEGVTQALGKLGYWLEAEAVDGEDNRIFEFQHSNLNPINIVVKAFVCDGHSPHEGEVKFRNQFCCYFCDTCYEEHLRVMQINDEINAKDEMKHEF